MEDGRTAAGRKVSEFGSLLAGRRSRCEKRTSGLLRVRLSVSEMSAACARRRRRTHRGDDSSPARSISLILRLLSAPLRVSIPAGGSPPRLAAEHPAPTSSSSLSLRRSLLRFAPRSLVLDHAARERQGGRRSAVGVGSWARSPRWAGQLLCRGASSSSSAPRRPPSRLADPSLSSCSQCRARKSRCSRTANCTSCTLRRLPCTWLPGTSPRCARLSRPPPQPLQLL